MRKAEAEQLQRRIRELEHETLRLKQTIANERQFINWMSPQLSKARRLLGRWMFERHDRERYPVTTTRDFLKNGA